MFRKPRFWLAGAVVIAVILGAVAVAQWARQPGAKVTSGDASPTVAPGPENGFVDPGGLGGLGSASASASRSASASGSAGKTSAPAVGPRVGGAFPGPGNTGIPSGTKLSAYSGPCTIDKAGTVIDAKTVNCDLVIKAANVTIKRSKVNGAVILDTDVSGSSGWSYTLSDSEVDAGVRQYPAVSYGNMTILRSNIYGGETSVQCGEHAVSCTVQDSWLHGQRIPDNANWHLGGFLSNGGRNIRVKHNTIVCDAPVNSVGEGCTGDLNLFGDFAVISDAIVDSNLFGATISSSYCLYAGDAASKKFPNANHVQIINNVFQIGSNKKCAAYGPVSGFNPAGAGNVWSNNTWEDGTPLHPAN
ncbi:hypothetical protein [Dactylosporangium sp. CA-233914]|uniref:hypothetical protein n=1 Tax=Dactylosporangium sp. CA-233914 TaxID=3239934 RepID=UPI003D8A7007